MDHFYQSTPGLSSSSCSSRAGKIEIKYFVRIWVLNDMFWKTTCQTADFAKGLRELQMR